MPPRTHRSLRATRLAQSQSQRRLWIVATAVASSGSALPTFTAQQVGQHRSEDDCWLVIDGFVYDITAFLRSHPGGIAIILPYAGRDATRIFHALHDADFLKEFGRRYIIGVLHGVDQPAVSRGTGLKGGGVTPRAGKLYLAEDPRGMEWPNDFPKAFRWLAARYVPPSLPLPLSLRPLSAAGGRSGATGLHVMTPAHWIEVDGDCFASEMAKKRKLLLTERSNAGENPWYNNVFQAETDTAAEQEELLEVLIDNLVTYHPDKYSLRGREIIVEETGDAYCIDDWIAPHTDSAGRPIAIQLASLLVQEEFYILRRKGKLDVATAAQEEEGVRGSPTGGLPGPAVEVPYRYEFCAGTSCLNFLRNGINGERGNMAPRNAMHTIHAPVPGMAEHGWHRKLGHIFSTLTDETALYRTNFGIDQDNRNTYYLDDHNEFQYAEAVLAECVFHRRRYGEGVKSLAEFRNRHLAVVRRPGDAFLTAEFQGITRLPRTKSIVFTLHKYFAPIASIHRAPEAAAMLHRAFSTTPPDKRTYSLGEDERWHEALLGYLKDAAQGL